MNTTCTCGCCEGVKTVTPMPTANRPGLTVLSFRVGTHATFLETMLARLSSLSLDEQPKGPVADEPPHLEAMGRGEGASAGKAKKGDQ